MPASPDQPSRSTAASRRPVAGDSDAVAPATLFALALLVGGVAGVGAIAFLAAIDLFLNLFLLGRAGEALAPAGHLPASGWGWGVVLVPVVGAVAVTWLHETFAQGPRDHGVPEVMHAIYYHGGRMRPMTVVARALASAVSIGTGGSVGREGPVIQIGSLVGASAARARTMPPRQRIVLVCAGAAAGIAAMFNAPLAGVAFAMELLLVSVSGLNVALVAAATVTATWVGRLYAGDGIPFAVPATELFADPVDGSVQLLLCVPFGLLAGAAAAGVVRAIFWFEDRFDAAFANPYLRHMTGMLVVGLMILAFFEYTGAHHVNGTGHATIVDALRTVLTDPLFLLLLFAAKLLATALTLGSGAAGGVVSPALFLGATLGAAWAGAIDWLLPEAGVDPVLFTVAGMAAVVGATTSAVVTAIVLILELTRDYSAILPVITVVALAYAVRVRLVPESFYTLTLARRGRDIPQGLQAAMPTTLDARRVMNRDFQIVELDRLREWESSHRPGEGARYTVVVRDGEIHGLAREDLPYLVADHELEDLVDRDVQLVPPRTRWPALLRAIRASGSDVVLVGRGRSVEGLRGVITAREIARASRDNAELID